MMTCHYQNLVLTYVLTEFGLSSKIESESDLLTKLKRSVMGVKFSTPSYVFRSARLSHLLINNVHQFIYNSFQIPKHFRISLLPLILFISYIFSVMFFFRVAFGTIYDCIISRYCEWFVHHMKVYFFERFLYCK